MVYFQFPFLYPYMYPVALWILAITTNGKQPLVLAQRQYINAANN